MRRVVCGSGMGVTRRARAEGCRSRGWRVASLDVSCRRGETRAALGARERGTDDGGNGGLPSESAPPLFLVECTSTFFGPFRASFFPRYHAALSRAYRGTEF